MMPGRRSPGPTAGSRAPEALGTVSTLLAPGSVRARTERRPVTGRCVDRWPAGWVVGEASTRRERGRGLLGLAGLPDRKGLWLPVRSVHTIGMRFALDLVWLDRDGRVVRVDEHVGRGRIRTCLRARGGVIELAAGSGLDFVETLSDVRQAPPGLRRSP